MKNKSATKRKTRKQRKPIPDYVGYSLKKNDGGDDDSDYYEDHDKIEDAITSSDEDDDGLVDVYKCERTYLGKFKVKSVVVKGPKKK